MKSKQDERDIEKEEKTAEPENPVAEARAPAGDEAALKEQLLRIAAEYDNYRKRSEREKAEIYLKAKADVVSKFLPVMDNFERAALNRDTSFEDYRKGVEMIFEQMLDAMCALDADFFGESGDGFDPNLHDAVMHVEDENLDSNMISEVFRKGCRIGDRVLRHATVVVAN